jgi:BCD family chlorophyll transporter-like MFS transporter
MKLRQSAIHAWMRLSPRFLPFADAATPNLPLSRLLRLSLFQVCVGMALVLLIGTLNRVMIVELGVSASLVGVMIALPLVFAPFRTLIGFRSDTHRSALGWRRAPFLYRGALLLFGGLSIMPFALLVLAGAGEAADAPAWVGPIAAALAFLLVGAGVHTVQTVGLALATDLAEPASRPKIVGLMYVMLMLGMVISAFAFGAALSPFSPGRLVQVIQASAVLSVVLIFVAAWKQEPRRRAVAVEPERRFRDAWTDFARGPRALRHLAVVGIGTMALSMEDVLLEPYGGQILGMSVADTTKLTATLAIGGIGGLALASRVLARGFDPVRLACLGIALAVPAFLAVLASAPLGSVPLFAIGVALIGMSGGLFGHGTLTAAMNRAAKAQAGLALGAWGAAQAFAAGTAVALGGVLRDLFLAAGSSPVAAYHGVYWLEVLLLLAALGVAAPLFTTRRSASTSGNVSGAHSADPAEAARPG